MGRHIHASRGVVQVLEASHAEVVRAEAELKRRYRARAVCGVGVILPRTFGVGTEVVGGRVRIDLTSVLRSGRDVTRRFWDE